MRIGKGEPNGFVIVIDRRGGRPEIEANSELNHSLKRGTKDAKAGRGRFV